MRLWTVVGLVLGIAAADAVHAQAVMKMASATINDVQHEWLKRFEAAVKPRTAERLKIEIYPASQLGQIPRMVEGVTVGTIESFVTPTSFLVSTEPRFQVLDAIGVFSSPEHLNRVLADDAYRSHILAIGEAKGLKGIGVFYNSPVVVLSRRPVTEIHPSIVVSTLVVNKRWFDSLPGDVRAAITEAGAKVDREAYGFAGALVERANKGWVDNGGQLLKLPAAEQAKMMADLKALGARILAEKPEVKAEYDELLKVAERTR